MGKVISIKQGRRMDTAAVANGEANPFREVAKIPITIGPNTSDLFLVEAGELEEAIEPNLLKRITYDMMDSEVSEPLVKPMWPLSF